MGRQLWAPSAQRAAAANMAAFMAGCYAQLGVMDRARACVAECLSLRPDFSVRHWMSKEPFKSEADAARIAEALRLAGLPD